MNNRKRFFVFIGVLLGFIFSYQNVFAYDKYTLEDYAFFDPVTTATCNSTNYWTPYNQDTTCYRFLVLDSNDSNSNSSIKLLLDHDIGSGSYSDSSSILSSVMSSWVRYSGSASLADEDTISALMKLSDLPKVTGSEVSTVNGGVPLYALATNTYYFIKNVDDVNNHGYWLSGTANNTDYAYVVTDGGNNSLALKTDVRGVRPMITVQKDLLTKSPDMININEAVGLTNPDDTTEFKYPAPSNSYGGVQYNGLQGFTLTNSMLVFHSYNSSNPDNGLLISYKDKDTDYSTLNDIQYGATGRGNGMTFNTRSNTVLVAGPNNYSEIYEYDANSLEKINSYSVPEKFTSIGYDFRKYYYAGLVGRRVYIMNESFEKYYTFDVPHYVTSQDLEYLNGYIYYAVSDNGSPNNYQLYGFSSKTARIYVYNAKLKRDGTPDNGFGRLVRTYYIDNFDSDGLGGVGELQGISFYNGLVWLGYNASAYDSSNPYKFYRFDFSKIMVIPNYKITYDEGEESTIVTVSSDTQLRPYSGWRASTDRCSMTKEFRDKQSAFSIGVNDEYYNGEVTTIRELTLKKSDISFPTANVSEPYSVDSIPHPASCSSSVPIIYSSSDTEVAEVDSNGNIITKKQGYATITATVAKGDGYYAGQARYGLTVTKALQVLTFSTDTVQKTYGDAPFKISLTQSLGDGNITYTSSDTSIASVASDGTVTIKGAGEGITIMATAAATDAFSETSASYSLSIARKSRTLSFSESTPTTAYVGSAPFEVNASISEGDGTVTYASDNTNVATIDNQGIVTIVGEGNAVITATVGETANYLGASTSFGLTVSQKSAQTLVFPSRNVEKTYGDAPFQILAQHTVGNGNVSYSCSNTDIAEVDATNGTVTIKTAGDVVITATASETASYTRTIATYSLQIKKKGQSISFAGTESGITKRFGDDDFVLAANRTDGEGTITYESSNGVVASVDLSGKVTIKNVGTTQIKAIAPETTNYSRTVVSYTLTVLKGQQVLNKNEDSPPIVVLDTVGTYQLEIDHEVGDGELSYSSSNEEVATIDQEALVTIVGPGTTLLTVVAEETDQYLSQVYSRVLEVESSPSPLTGGSGTVDQVVKVDNTGILRHFPFISIGFILLGLYYLYKQEFIFIKKK